MRATLRSILLFSVFILTASCGEYSHYLKSKNPLETYEGAMKYYNQGKYGKAIPLFEYCIPDLEGLPMQDSVNFYYAKSHYLKNDLVQASTLLEEFRTRFGRSQLLEEAEYLYAICNYKMSPSVKRDQTLTQKAITELNSYMGRYPNSPRRADCEKCVAELEDKMYEKAFLNARLYYDMSYYTAAIQAFKASLKEYPQTPYREETLFLILKANYEYAKHSVPEKQTERYINTIDAYYSMKGQFPESKYMKEMDKMHKEANEYVAKHPQASPASGAADTDKQPAK